ncbi:MAG: hypothetical protein U0637_02245 [Phycisphaerales bacterium]
MADHTTDIEALCDRVQAALRDVAASRTHERVWATHYGAVTIDPAHLVCWLVVQTEAERRRLEADAELTRRLRSVLDTLDYPASARAKAHIGFESEERVQRETGGDYWRYWK